MKIILATPHPRHDAMESRLRSGGLDVLRVRSAEELLTVAEESPRYIFFPHWSWKIPPEVFENTECVIFHMTDVPFGRGGSPLQNLIVRGFHETKMTALRCVAEMDAGPVYMKEPLTLDGTAEEILRRAGDVIEKMIQRIVADQPTPVPQEGEVVTFKRRKPEDGNLEPLTTPLQVFDYIRMLDADGYPPAFIETEHFRIDFFNARCEDDGILAQARFTLKSKE